MPRQLNPMGKMRPVETPYLIIEDKNGAFGPTTFKVLKSYQIDPMKPYARVMVQAISSATGLYGDMGDAYWGDVTGEITFRDPVVTDDLLPNHLKGGENKSTTLDGVMDMLLGQENG
jgi:hypothetical protein